jgi:hypothetical protein
VDTGPAPEPGARATEPGGPAPKTVDGTVQAAIDSASRADAAVVAYVAHGGRARWAFGARNGRVLYLSAILLLAVALLLVLLGVVLLRPGAGTPAAEAPAGGTGPAAGEVDDGGAAPAQDQAAGAGVPGQDAAGQPPVDQPADQPADAGAVPQSCVVPRGEALVIDLADVTWRDEEDGTYAAWAAVVHNVGSETFSVIVHRVAGANEATLANRWEMPPTGWDTEARWIIDPDAPDQAITDFDGSVDTSVEAGLPTLCHWEYADRLVAVYSRPECIDVLWEKLRAVAADPAAQEALMGPLAVTLPTPDRMNGWVCPE